MASIFFYGWIGVALFVFICIMIVLIVDRNKRKKQDEIRAMWIREAERRGW